ncbi:putative U-box domain-containing protein [Drosera capensis]
MRMALLDLQAHEKVYVAVGSDVNEGVLTLEWVIEKWGSHPITIVILHADASNSMEFVHTPFGKLPASAVSEKKLELLRKLEKEKTDKMLSKYIATCGKVKAEIHKIQKFEEPIRNAMVELIMEHRITKLVMTMTFVKPSSGRSKSAMSGSFYVHRNKPNFCDLYILCGGKLVILEEEKDEGMMEDEQGASLKQKNNLRGWLGKVLANGRSPTSPSSISARSLDSPSPKNKWEFYAQEIEEYFHQLLMMKDNDDVDENVALDPSPLEPSTIREFVKNDREKLADVKVKIEDAQKVIQLKKDEAKADVERQARATWVICLCNLRILGVVWLKLTALDKTLRVEELEGRINHEVAMRISFRKELEETKDRMHEVLDDLEESKDRLSSMSELQAELSSKLQVSSLAKSCAEVQLETAVKARGGVVREIEELRKQRDILQRRIEFCKEKDANGMNIYETSQVFNCNYKEFNANEIRHVVATDDFATRNRLKGKGDWTRVYKGKMNHAPVAVVMPNPNVELPEDVFQAKVMRNAYILKPLMTVNLLVSIRHPNITALVGFCSELKCFVFEYLQNGCLRDTLFTRRSRTLKWHHRVNIAAQICSGVSFLHESKPQPIIHGSLNPSNILLDINFQAKINAFDLSPCCDELDVHADVQVFGTLLLQLLCGRNWDGLEWEMMGDKAVILGALDDSSGDWPPGLAEALVDSAMKCLAVDSAGLQSALIMGSMMKEIDGVRKDVDEFSARRERKTEETNVPSIFRCPIFQEVMQNPHLAADGFSYELEAIEEWLRTGNDSSPVTNLKLDHTQLIPNHTLRAVIEDWCNKESSSV